MATREEIEEEDRRGWVGREFLMFEKNKSLNLYLIHVKHREKNENCPNGGLKER